MGNIQSLNNINPLGLTDNGSFQHLYNLIAPSFNANEGIKVNDFNEAFKVLKKIGYINKAKEIFEDKITSFNIYQFQDILMIFPSEYHQDMIEKYTINNNIKSLDVKRLNRGILSSNKMLFDYCNFQYEDFKLLMELIDRDDIEKGNTINFIRWIDSDILIILESLSNKTRFNFIHPSSFEEAMKIDGFTSDLMTKSIPSTAPDAAIQLFELGAQLNDEFINSYYPSSENYINLCIAISHKSFTECSEVARKKFLTKMINYINITKMPKKEDYVKLFENMIMEGSKVKSFDCSICMTNRYATIAGRCRERAENVSYICINCYSKLNKCPTCYKDNLMIEKF